eukprot:403363749
MSSSSQLTSAVANTRGANSNSTAINQSVAQNRVRVYVTIEFKGSNARRHLCVSEIPEKNIIELKRRIENEFNTIYKDQEIEISDILLNDMFPITKDYSVGDILENDQNIKVLARFKKQHREKVNSQSQGNSQQTSAPGGIQPNSSIPKDLEAVQSSQKHRQSQIMPSCITESYHLNSGASNSYQVGISEQNNSQHSRDNSINNQNTNNLNFNDLSVNNVNLQDDLSSIIASTAQNSLERLHQQSQILLQGEPFKNKIVKKRQIQIAPNNEGGNRRSGGNGGNRSSRNKNNQQQASNVQVKKEPTDDTSKTDKPPATTSRSRTRNSQTTTTTPTGAKSRRRVKQDDKQQQQNDKNEKQQAVNNNELPKPIKANVKPKTVSNASNKEVKESPTKSVVNKRKKVDNKKKEVEDEEEEQIQPTEKKIIEKIPMNFSKVDTDDKAGSSTSNRLTSLKERIQQVQQKKQAESGSKSNSDSNGEEKKLENSTPITTLTTAQKPVQTKPIVKTSTIVTSPSQISCNFQLKNGSTSRKIGLLQSIQNSNKITGKRDKTETQMSQRQEVQDDQNDKLELEVNDKDFSMPPPFISPSVQDIDLPPAQETTSQKLKKANASTFNNKNSGKMSLGKTLTLNQPSSSTMTSLKPLLKKPLTSLKSNHMNLGLGEKNTNGSGDEGNSSSNLGESEIGQMILEEDNDISPDLSENVQLPAYDKKQSTDKRGKREELNNMHDGLVFQNDMEPNYIMNESDVC